MGDVCPQACPSNHTHTYATLLNQSTGSCKHHFKGRHYARKMSLAISQFHASVQATCLWKMAGHGRKVRAPNSESKPVIGMEESEFSAADRPPPLHWYSTVVSLEKSSVGITSSGLKSGLKITQHEEVRVLHVSPYLWKYS